MKKINKSVIAIKIAFLASLVNTNQAFACAACGCTLSSDWENLSFSSSAGFKLDIRYDYLHQNQLRSGMKTISPSAASKVINDGEPQEVERFTKNNYLTLGLDYSPNIDWGVNIQLPYIDRSHSTLGTASDGVTPGDDGEQYDSKTSNIGDIKVIGRFQGFNEQHNFGILFGLKLPTGSYKEVGTSTDVNAPGDIIIDKGLQPGTGSTDVIVGAYYSEMLNKNWDYFSQAIYQTALDTKDDYKPGNGLNVNLGIRYLGFSEVTPQLQLNARNVKHDTGENADTISTGGTLIYLSPGISVPISDQASINGYVQLPIYQNIRGVQLLPRYTASISLRVKF